MMDSKILESILEGIKPLDARLILKAANRWDSLTKPPKSLGKLEDLISRLCAIQQKEFPDISRRTLLCFAADHGVVAEGVSPSKQVVTMEMVRNFLKGGAAISVLCKSCSTELKVFNTGMVYKVDDPRVIQKPIAPGTQNMRRTKAMSTEQVYTALNIGYEAAMEEIESGTELLLCGEMGVGNTTSASAIYAALTGTDPEQLTGTGAGLPASRVSHKALVIRETLSLHHPDPSDPVDILSAVGGFELAAMCGVMIAGARHRCPVVVDGFISGASALLAMKFHPLIREYLVFSHQSGEAGFRDLCSRFDIDPLVDLNMRLGEGTGAVMIIPLIENALACFKDMATFEEAGVTEIEI